MSDLPADEDAVWISPEPAAIAAALHIPDSPAALRISHRDDRFVAFLGDEQLVWFPQTKAGRTLVEREGRVLDVIARWCSFQAPRVLDRRPNWQLRSVVAGSVDPWTLYQRVRSDAGYARTLGHAVGTFLADQHRNVPLSALAGWLPTRPQWPYALPRIASDLPYVVADTALVLRLLEVITSYETLCATTADPVLLHGDLGLHNLAIGSDGALAGVFDYGDAAVGDRHRDFAYLLFDSTDDQLLFSAVDAYRAAGGPPIDLDRVALCNAACAIGFMAFRRGHGPGDKPAGRTFDQDMAWLRQALSRLQC